MLYTLHYITDLLHICKIQWNLIKDEMRRWVISQKSAYLSSREILSTWDITYKRGK